MVVLYEPLRGFTIRFGVQYVSIHYTERLAKAGIEPSVGSVGDSYDNALAETIIGLFKTEIIRPRGTSRTGKKGVWIIANWSTPGLMASTSKPGSSARRRVCWS